MTELQLDNSTSPYSTDTLKRSPLNRLHHRNGAMFKAHGEVQLVARYQTPSLEQQSAQNLGLVDLTALERIGFKGPNTRDWLEARGLKLPPAANWADGTQGHGMCTAALSNTEFLILDRVDKATSSITELRNAWSMDIEEKTYLLERAHSHAWFAVCGQYAAEMFSKLCAIDLRHHKFQQHQIAQTSVARCSAIIMRCDQGDTSCFHLLFDLSYTEYMWQCLLDAMQEYQGMPIGHTAFSGLSSK